MKVTVEIEVTDEEFKDLERYVRLNIQMEQAQMIIMDTPEKLLARLYLLVAKARGE